MSDIAITPLSAAPRIRAMLAEILVEAVASGGSVSFMDPLDPQVAAAFWDQALAASARGERIVFGAWDGEVLAGTVTLLLDCPPNQPHRAEIAKLMTRQSHRGRGSVARNLRGAIGAAAWRAPSCGPRSNVPWRGERRCSSSIRRTKAAPQASTSGLATRTRARSRITRSSLRAG